MPAMGMLRSGGRSVWRQPMGQCCIGVDSQALVGDAHHGFELLKKPYSVEALLEALENALKR